jgi:hypothetical protein
VLHLPGVRSRGAFGGEQQNACMPVDREVLAQLTTALIALKGA